MIITLSGRRIDARNASIARFPLEKSAIVQKRIQKLLQEQQATALVSSAACGADLLALEAAGKLGMRRRIILTFEPQRFRASSVADRPGDWAPLFDRIIAEVQAAGDLVLLHEKNDDNAAFIRTNLVILDEAQKLASENQAESDAIMAVLVWEGEPRGAGDVTADFAREARARNIPVAEIAI